MAGVMWDRHFFTTTRGRIVLLLRDEPRTVEELAHTLELTDNAIRGQLALLERDGLVRQEGLRRGTSKPAVVYGLSPDAENLFPKAYVPVLGHLLDALVADMTPAEFENVLRETGRRLAEDHGSPSGNLETRLRVAAETLSALGGVAEVEASEHTHVIRGRSCPLAAVSPTHPEVCRLTAALVSQIVGRPVEERCSRESTSPRCCFVV